MIQNKGEDIAGNRHVFRKLLPDNQLRTSTFKMLDLLYDPHTFETDVRLLLPNVAKSVLAVGKVRYPTLFPPLRGFDSRAGKGGSSIHGPMGVNRD